MTDQVTPKRHAITYSEPKACPSPTRNGTLDGGAGDIDVVLEFLGERPEQAYDVDELRRVTELPQRYASQYEITAAGEVGVVAEHLIKRYFRLILELLVSENEIERATRRGSCTTGRGMHYWAR